MDGAVRTLGLDLGGTNIKLVVLHDGELIDQRETATPVGGRRSCGRSAAHGRARPFGRASRLDRRRAARSLQRCRGGAAPAESLRRVDGNGGPGTARGGLRKSRTPDQRRSRVCARRESLLGAGRGASNVMCIVCGTGIGGGLILGGKLHLAGRAPARASSATTPWRRTGRRVSAATAGASSLYAGARAIAAAAGAPTFDETLARARSGDAAALTALAQRRRADRARSRERPDLPGARPGRDRRGRRSRGRAAPRLTANVRGRPCSRGGPLDLIAITAAELGPRAGAIGAALWGSGTDH